MDKQRIIEVIDELSPQQLLELSTFLRLLTDQPVSDEKRIFTFDLHRGKIWMADDFNAELPDSFWLGDDNDPLYA